MAVQLFGYLLAGGVLLSSLAMFALGGRFQQVEQAAYAGARRPLWFWAVSAVVVVLYLAALVSFVAGPKTWAGWLLMVILPLGWALKAGLVIVNPAGRAQVTAIEGDAAWRKVALLRLPIAAALFGLAALV